MTLITGLTSEPNQSQNLILPDGSSAPFSMSYCDQQQAWFMALSYPGWSGVTNKRLVVSPNMLRSFRSIIPFGIGLKTNDGYEPLFITDFVSGRAKLFLLDANDVQQYENILTQDYSYVS